MHVCFPPVFCGPGLETGRGVRIWILVGKLRSLAALGWRASQNRHLRLRRGAITPIPRSSEGNDRGRRGGINGWYLRCSGNHDRREISRAVSADELLSRTLSPKPTWVHGNLKVRSNST